MRTFKKIFIITMVLLTPALVFLFLKNFGSNKFDLPLLYESGNPIKECNTNGQAHRVSQDFIQGFNLKLPFLFLVGSVGDSEYVADLGNVLSKYNGINLYQTGELTSGDWQQVSLDSIQLIEAVNCELVFGEDRYLVVAPINKMVMVDGNRQIRSYLMTDDLAEIDRLDVELDILLNY